MLFGHAAVGSLAGRSVFRGLSPLFLMAAAYGPDWLDKPLKYFFKTPGHGLAHAGLTYAALALAVFLGRRRLGRFLPYALAAVVLWGLHLVCDWVDPRILFWPLFGWTMPNPHPEPTLTVARGFYVWPHMHPLAWIDLALCSLALAAGLAPPVKRALARGGPVFSPMTGEEAMKRECSGRATRREGRFKTYWLWAAFGVALAVCLIVAACGNAPPLKDAFPKEAAGMTLTELYAGPEALTRIMSLHGGKLEAVDGAVAVYRAPGARPAVIWAVRAPSAEIAEKQTKAMLESLLRAPLAPFREPVTAEMDGLSVTRFKGLEQSHFIFQRGDRSWWLSADPDAAPGLLKVFVAKAKEG